MSGPAIVQIVQKFEGSGFNVEQDRGTGKLKP